MNRIINGLIFILLRNRMVPEGESRSECVANNFVRKEPFNNIRIWV